MIARPLHRFAAGLTRTGHATISGAMDRLFASFPTTLTTVRT
jgi:hypothetical protein